MDDCYEVKITSHAEASMQEIAQYIAFELLAPDAAINLLMTFQKEIDKLDHTPHRVHLTPEEPWHSEGIHRLPVKNFYVYFWIDEGRKKGSSHRCGLHETGSAATADGYAAGRRTIEYVLWKRSGNRALFLRFGGNEYEQ